MTTDHAIALFERVRGNGAYGAMALSPTVGNNQTWWWGTAHADMRPNFTGDQARQCSRVQAAAHVLRLVAQADTFIAKQLDDTFLVILDNAAGVGYDFQLTCYGDINLTHETELIACKIPIFTPGPDDTPDGFLRLWLRPDEAERFRDTYHWEELRPVMAEVMRAIRRHVQDPLVLRGLMLQKVFGDGLRSLHDGTLTAVSVG
jgi:hypothetical protein